MKGLSMKYNDSISEQRAAEKRAPFRKALQLGQWSHLIGIVAIVIGLIGAFSSTWLWLMVAVGGLIIVLLSMLIGIAGEIGNRLDAKGMI